MIVTGTGMLTRSQVLWKPLRLMFKRVDLSLIV